MARGARLRARRRVRFRGRRAGRLVAFDALAQFVESSRRHLLDAHVGRNDPMDLTLSGALVAAAATEAQVRFDASAVRLAQAAIDEPRQEIPDLLVLGGW